MGYTGSDLDRLRDLLGADVCEDGEDGERDVFDADPSLRGAIDVECPACGHAFTA